MQVAVEDEPRDGEWDQPGSAEPEEEEEEDGESDWEEGEEDW